MAVEVASGRHGRGFERRRGVGAGAVGASGGSGGAGDLVARARAGRQARTRITPDNRYGMGLVGKGSAGEHDPTRKLGGPGAFVLVIFADVTPARYSADLLWKQPIQDAHDRNLVPGSPARGGIEQEVRGKVEG